jgi:hypothetical protein
VAGTSEKWVIRHPHAQPAFNVLFNPNVHVLFHVSIGAKAEILKFFLVADGEEIGREAIGLCRSRTTLTVSCWL